jgi:uncharacterized membrane protein HdeD (DUF308 family)
MNTNSANRTTETTKIAPSNHPLKDASAAATIARSLVWRGLLAIAIGIVSVIWPDITVGAFVIVFAVYAFVAAGADATRAFSSARVGPVFGHVLLSLLSLAAGVVALVWPGPTALVLTLLVGWWALITGLVEIAMAFASGRRAGDRAWWVVSGLLSIVFAAVLFIRPDIGAVSLAIVFGLYSMIYGVAVLMAGREVRRLEHTVRRAAEALS